MPTRSIRLATLCASAAFLPVLPVPHVHRAGQETSAPPTKTRYKIDQTSSQEIDASAVGGPKQSVTNHLVAYVLITLADTTGGRTMHVVVDSVVGDTASAIPKAVLDSLKGGTYHGQVAPNNRITDLRPMNGAEANTPITGLLSNFYPRVRTGWKTGDSWTDTTETTNPVPNGQLTVRTVTNYKANPAEQRDGQKASRIDAAFASSLTGSQETPNGSASFTGSGTGTATQYLTSDNRYLGGTTTQTSNLSVTGSFAPQPIPITIKQTTTVSTLK
jgi:hypothetical protein